MKPDSKSIKLCRLTFFIKECGVYKKKNKNAEP